MGADVKRCCKRFGLAFDAMVYAKVCAMVYSMVCSIAFWSQFMVFADANNSDLLSVPERIPIGECTKLIINQFE